MKWSSPSVRGCWVLLASLVSVGVTSAQAQTPASCDTSYTQAQEAYYAADFETAVALLRPCAQQPALTDSARVRMYRLLSFVYLGQNDRPSARQAVESLLDLQPDYAPNPAQDRPDFVALVQTAKEERTAQTEAEEGSRRWLRWALGAVAASALGTAAVLLFGGGDSGDDTDTLPRPAPPPEE